MVAARAEGVGEPPQEVEGQLREKKVALTLTDAARAWLAEEGFDPDFGARPLARVIQTTLSDRISQEILFGALAKGGRATIDRGESGLVFSFEAR